MKKSADNSLRERLTALRNAAIDNYKDTPHPQRLLKTLCQHVDRILIEAWQQTGLPSEHVLVAVGGYGRGELYPHSDIDVLILLNRTPDSELQQKIETLIQCFWSLGLTIWPQRPYYRRMSGRIGT